MSSASEDMVTIDGFTLTPGVAQGTALVLDEPLSFWGGVDRFGDIIDVHHPQHGHNVVGKVLVMTSGRGSSSGAYTLGELLRTGHSPAAIVLAEPDGIIAMGSIVATQLYGVHMPFVNVELSDLARIRNGDVIHVEATPDGATLSWAS